MDSRRQRFMERIRGRNQYYMEPHRQRFMKIIRERSQYDMESHRQRFMNNVIFQSTMKTNNLISTLKNKHVKMEWN